jgi:excisionase family DNA binding protein
LSVVNVSTLLTIPEAAAALSVSESTVRRLLADGRLSKIAPSPGCVRIERQAIDRYLAQCRGERWQSKAKPVVGSLSFSAAGSAYIAAARRGRRDRRQSNSKRASAAKSTTKSSAAVLSFPSPTPSAPGSMKPSPAGEANAKPETTLTPSSTRSTARR